jgi:purine-nucleoside phosphorylase
MPTRLRPTASYAADAIVVGDPGRALLLAQELLTQPKMSNHARGLWGYAGQTPAGRSLTIQSTGIGGPSAALVLGDLAELGVRRALRLGTCVGVEETAKLGELLVVGEAIAGGGSAAAHGVGVNETVAPDENLTARLIAELGETAREVTIASLDAHPGHPPVPAGVAAADMQTAPLLARARSLKIEVAALLIVAETTDDELLDKEQLERVEMDAGRAVANVLSI